MEGVGQGASRARSSMLGGVGTVMLANTVAGRDRTGKKEVNVGRPGEIHLKVRSLERV